jgi:hypothetical protein
LAYVKEESLNVVPEPRFAPVVMGARVVSKLRPERKMRMEGLALLTPSAAGIYHTLLDFLRCSGKERNEHTMFLYHVSQLTVLAIQHQY